MHYRVVFFSSGAFILLLIFTIGQQIKTFIERRANPVSSINYIYGENGKHESTVGMMTAMTLFPKNNSSRVDIEYEEYHLTDRCLCLNRTSGVHSSSFVNCTNIITMDVPNSSAIGSNTLIWENPIWHDQKEAMICENPKDRPVVFLFIAVTESWTTLVNNWAKMSLEEQHAYVDMSFSNNIHTWVHCNFYNKLRLTRVEYLEDHKLEKVQIRVSTSTAQNVYLGQTRIMVEWRESFINQIDKFHDANCWSFALLLCSVILGLERCYAIFNRARALKLKQRKKKKSLATALSTIHANMDVA